MMPIFSLLAVEWFKYHLVETTDLFKNMVTLDRIQIIRLGEEETTESHSWSITNSL